MNSKHIAMSLLCLLGVSLLAVNDILANPIANQPYTLNPPNGWNTGTSFYLDLDTKPTLLSQLADPLYRNFFWFGHGAPEGIGYSHRDEKHNRIPGVRITVSELREALGNKGKIRHGYRLVFLHSCSGASGALPRAFGIDPRPLSVAHYQTTGMKTRAFIGATDEMDGVFDPGEYSKIGESFTIFFGSWMGGVNASNCLSAAQSPAGPFETRIPLHPLFTVVGATNLSRSSP